MPGSPASAPVIVLSPCRGVQVVLGEAAFQLGDPRAGVGELVLQGDDAGGGVEVQPVVEQGPHPGGDASWRRE